MATQTCPSGIGSGAARPARPKVAVFGAGPAGLTAAHELAERGFAVEVYERHPVVGGKCRSFGVPGTGTDGRRDLPAEMGPHFFMGYYPNLGETLGRIPAGPGRTVLNNLTSNYNAELFWGGKQYAVPALGRKPGNGLRDALDALAMARKLTPRDLKALIPKLGRLMRVTDSAELERLEQISITDYLGWDTLTPQARELVVTITQGNTMGPERMSARSYAQGMLVSACLEPLLRMGWGKGFLRYGTGFDSMVAVSDGPMNEAWFDPWAAHLRDTLGVGIHTGYRAVEVHYDDDRIAGVTVKARNGRTRRIEADYYVLAMPHDKQAELMTDALVAADPMLGRIAAIEDTWLGAIQLYLKKLPSIADMCLTMDQPWTLGFAVQSEAWTSEFAATYGDGTVVGHISVDLASWDRPGILYGKPANRCTPDEMYEEIRAQLRASTGDPTLLPDADIHSWFYNPTLAMDESGQVVNDEPLFATTPGGWANQPEAVTAIPNLFLAGTHVRTGMGIDCMESANESGKAAALGILAAAGHYANPVQINPAPRGFRAQHPERFRPAHELRDVVRTPSRRRVTAIG